MKILNIDLLFEVASHEGEGLIQRVCLIVLFPLFFFWAVLSFAYYFAKYRSSEQAWSALGKYLSDKEDENGGIEVLATVMMADGKVSKAERKEAYRRISEHFDGGIRTIEKFVLWCFLRSKKSPETYCGYFRSLRPMIYNEPNLNSLDCLATLVTLFEVATAESPLSKAKGEAIGRFAHEQHISAEDLAALTGHYEQAQTDLARVNQDSN